MHRLPAEVLVAWTGIWIVRKGVSLRVSLGLLMDERETDIVLKLRDRKIQLIAVLTVFVRVQPVQKLLRKRAYHRLLVIVDHILEELIDELHLEVGEVETDWAMEMYRPTSLFLSWGHRQPRPFAHRWLPTRSRPWSCFPPSMAPLAHATRCAC